MEDQQGFHDDQQSRGRGAALFKHGLGFGGSATTAPGKDSGSSYSKEQQQQQQKAPPPGAPPPTGAIAPPPAYPYPYPYPQPGYPPPGQHYPGYSPHGPVAVQPPHPHHQAHPPAPYPPPYPGAAPPPAPYAPPPAAGYPSGYPPQAPPPGGYPHGYGPHPGAPPSYTPQQYPPPGYPQYPHPSQVHPAPPPGAPPPYPPAVAPPYGGQALPPPPRAPPGAPPGPTAPGGGAVPPPRPPPGPPPGAPPRPGGAPLPVAAPGGHSQHPHSQPPPAAGTAGPWHPGQVPQPHPHALPPHHSHPYMAVRPPSYGHHPQYGAYPGGPPPPHAPPYGMPPPGDPNAAAAAAAAAAQQQEQQKEAAAVEEAAAAAAAEEAAQREAAEAEAAAAIEMDRRRAYEAERKAKEERMRQVLAAWTVHKSEDGSVYYYNTVTEESSWEKPPGFKGEVQDVAEAPVPVETKQVGDTDWQEVKCADGRVYFYNETTEETSWAVPEPVAAFRRQQQEAEAARCKEEEEKRRVARMDAEAAARQRAGAMPGGLGGLVPYGRTMGMMVGGFPGARMAAMLGGPHALLPGHPLLVPRPPSKDELVGRFKELLMDKGVTPFSRWERELPKLEADKRWAGLTSLTLKEKRLAFDEFCRSTAAEQKQLKERRAAAALAGFKQLLDDVLVLERHVREQAKAEEREARLAAREEGEDGEEEEEEDVEESERRHRGHRRRRQRQRHGDAVGADHADPSNGHGEGPPEGGVGKKKATGGETSGEAEEQEEQETEEEEEEEEEDLSEEALVASLTLEYVGRYWANDDRWSAVTEEVRKQLFEERFGAAQAAARKARQVAEAAAQEGFFALLREREVTSSTRWSRIKDELASDPRFRALPGGRDAAEAAFGRFVAALDEAARAGEEEARKRAEAARRTQEATLEAQERRRRAAHDDAVTAFSTLLGEVVREPFGEWRDWRARLDKDPLGRSRNEHLEAREAEDLFYRHMAGLMSGLKRGFEDLLNEKLRPLLPGDTLLDPASLPGPLGDFATADALLEEDTRWARVPLEARERGWRTWVEDMLQPGAPTRPPLDFLTPPGAPQVASYAGGGYGGAYGTSYDMRGPYSNNAHGVAGGGWQGAGGGGGGGGGGGMYGSRGGAGEGLQGASSQQQQQYHNQPPNLHQQQPQHQPAPAPPRGGGAGGGGGGKSAGHGGGDAAQVFSREDRDRGRADYERAKTYVSDYDRDREYDRERDRNREYDRERDRDRDRGGRERDRERAERDVKKRARY